MLQPTLPSSLLTGQLFTYGSNRVAFESFVASSLLSPSVSPEPTLHRQQQLPPPNKCILLGGLSDGLIPVPYTHALSEMVCQFPYPSTFTTLTPENSDTNEPFRPSALPEEPTWSLVQPILSSSYTGFGHGTLDRDVTEIQELIQYLYRYRNATQNIMLIGHSTGCQQIVHYFRQYQHHPNDGPQVTAAVLQAPVSDREAATIWNPNESLYSSDQEHQEQLQKYIALAMEMKEHPHRGHEMMPRNAFWAPITAHRYYDLMVKGLGLDDYFSSDYTNEELQARLSHISSSPVLRRVIVAYSGQDEYVPKHLDTQVLLQRLCRAMNHGEADDDDDDDDGTTTRTPHGIAQPLYLAYGNHNLSSRNGADAQLLIQHIYNVMMELTTTK